MTPAEIDQLIADNLIPTPAQQVTRIDWILANGKAGMSYSIRGRQMTYPSIEACLKLRDYYAGLADQSVIPADGAMGNVSLVRFRDPFPTDL